MAASFFFYDLETTGINPREGRIMQFAGQRTDMDLKYVGEPVNILVKLTPDILPEPDAIMVTGITPQATLADGISEAEFIKIFQNDVATPDTIFIGFNTVRFDDEFMRFTLYRNFTDPYTWQWKDGRSRWDLLDLVRMTRALRPEGIEWPFAPDGKPTVRLELLTKANGLDHEKAHDALNDVYASIAVADLVKTKQPKLFEFLLKMRNKKEVEKLVTTEKAFVYTSGKYANEYEKTTVVTALAKHSKKQGMVVYDLRYDPSEYLGMTVQELVDRMAWVKDRESSAARLPVKTLQYNRCPAIAPLGVLDATAQKRLQVDLATIEENRKKLEGAEEFKKNVLAALDLNDSKRQVEWANDDQDVDSQIYNGFFDDSDARLLPVVCAAAPEELMGLQDDLHDKRLKALLPLYKARNYSSSLTAEERVVWDEFCKQRLFGGEANSRFARFALRLEELGASKLTQNQKFALEELRLYAESIMPAELI